MNACIRERYVAQVHIVADTDEACRRMGGCDFGYVGPGFVLQERHKKHNNGSSSSVRGSRRNAKPRLGIDYRSSSVATWNTRRACW